MRRASIPRQFCEASWRQGPSALSLIFCIRSAIRRGIITLTKQAQNLDSLAASQIREAGAPDSISIEVTPAMIAAGIYAAREHCLGEGLESLVRSVYLAMALEA